MTTRKTTRFDIETAATMLVEAVLATSPIDDDESVDAGVKGVVDTVLRVLAARVPEDRHADLEVIVENAVWTALGCEDEG